jgi:Protein of unknown function (DUF2938)
MTGDIDGAIRVVLIGVGATVAMDAWRLLMKRLRVPTPDFALVGRWAGHLARGRWSHAAIAKAAPVAGERALGWALHYATGVAFAALLVAIAGTAWMRSPTPLPALVVGLGTVAVPLFVMQPAMGAGIASSRTATPLKNTLRSVANHAAFGVGLYLAAVAVAAAWR